MSGSRTKAMLLSALMVLSVVAIGVTFAGSAAAVSTDANIADGSVIADGADPGETATHIHRIDIGSNNLGDGTLENITINYSSSSGIDLTDLDVVADSQAVGTTASGLDSAEDISIFIDGANVTDSSTNVTLATSDSNTTLTIGGEEGGGSDLSSVTNSGLSTGSTVTVVLDANGATLNNPSSSTTVDVTIGESGSSTNTGTVSNMDLSLGTDAPIKVKNTDGTVASNDTVLSSASSAVNSNNEQVAIEGSVDNTDPTGGSLSFSSFTANNDGLTINGTTSDASISVDTNLNSSIDINNIDGLTIEDLTFNGTDSADNLLEIGSGDTTTGNVSITNNVFNDTSGQALIANVSEGSDDDPATNDINKNEFNGVSEAINLKVVGNGNLDTGDAVNVEDNTINSFGVTNAFTLEAIPIDVLTFKGNDFDGGGSGTAILIDTIGENVTIADGSVNDVATGVDIQDTYSGTNGAVTVSGTVLTNVSSNAVNVGTVASTNDLVVIDSITIDNSSGATAGVNLGANANFDVTNSSISNTGNGILAGSSGAVGVISNTTITNTVTKAIDLNDPTTGNTQIDINQSTSIDNATNGVEIAHSSSNELKLDITDTQINGTTGAVNVTSMDGTASNNKFTINSSTFTNNTAGFALGDITGSNVSSTIDINLNTFENNGDAVVTDDPASSNAFTGSIVLHFNDFVSNGNGLKTINFEGSGTTGVINAKYNYWDDSTGPYSTNSNVAGYGTGDNITLSSSNDANVFPHLKQSINSFSTAQLNGNQLLLIENPRHPQKVERQKVSVTTLDPSAGITANNVVTTSGHSWETLNDPSGGTTLSPNNVAQFDVRDLEVGDYEITADASEIQSDTINQRVTTDSIDSVSISEADGSNTVASDGQLNLTATMSDSNNNTRLRQGETVRYTTNGFSDAGLKLANNGTDRTTTTNDGEAIFVVKPDGNNFEPGKTASVDVQMGTDPNSASSTFTINTATGSVDSVNLFLNGANFENDDNSGIEVNTTHDLTANVTDSSGNPLNQSVTFDSNNSVFSGSSSTTVQTGSDGNATATFTLPTSVGTTKLTASVGSTTNTSNITTAAGAVDTLAFDSGTPSVAPGSTSTADVIIEDQFGNQNTSVTLSDTSVTATSGDTSILSVQSSGDFSGGQPATFTLKGESAGSTSLNITSGDSRISSLNQTVNVVDPENGDLTLTAPHNIAKSSASAQNAVLITAQFKDANGNDLGVNNENITFTRASGTAAKLDPNSDNTLKTDGDGNVSIYVNATDTTGTTTFDAFSENYSNPEGSVTVRTTGAADDIAITSESSTVTAGDNETNLSVEYIDSNGNNVPKLADLNARVSTQNGGQIDEGATPASVTDGKVNATFTYNASNAEAGDVSIRGFGSGLSSTTTITVEAAATPNQPTGSVTFNDQTVANGTEEVTVANANYTLADGSNGTYVVVAHVVNDDGSISNPVGYSSNVTGDTDGITVDLNASEAQGDALDTLTANTTLRAMLHETSSDSAFGPSLGLATDDANITVQETGAPSAIPGVGGSAPVDNDGDGLYEDVNGDGTTNFTDAVDLAFANFGSLTPAQQSALDFDGDNDVDFDDAVELAFNV